MANLVEEIKKLRERKSLIDKLVVQEIEWDLDHKFIGEPMVPRTLKALSRYVDSKLVDYSSILGSIPATNMPPDADEHVCSERGPDGPKITDLTVYDYGHPEQGSIIDAPDLLDAAEKTGITCRAVLRPDRHVQQDLIDPTTGRPGSEVLDEFADRQVEDNGEDISSEEDPPFRLPGEELLESSYISELEGDAQTIIGGSINSLDYDLHGWLRQQQQPQAVIEGVVPGTSVNAAYGAVGRDIQVYAHGALPEARNRFRDSFVRDHHITLRILPKSSSQDKEISYVTSYTVEHSTMKIKARVITAPNNFQLLDDFWYDLCDADGNRNIHNLSLKDMIQDTIKANLCIISKSRAEFLNDLKDITIQEFEQTALETLREMISEREFRNYLRYGFILVRGQSGRIYQIFKNKQHTKVWEQGKLVEEICVRIEGNVHVPPTDNVIAFKTMIETSEDFFKSSGNIYKMDKTA
jgi:hypothetical protein